MVLRFFILAGVFLFMSCADGERDNPDDKESKNYQPPSSSSKPSSSSAELPSKGNNIANYGTVQIGDQVWMAENLDYDVSGSKCYYNDPDYCATYGRLYDWATAMGIDAKYNSQEWGGSDVKHRGICPSGWHIPSNAEWDKLYRYVDGSTGTNSPYSSPTAGTKLKATSGWNEGGNGQDTYGFSALPGGRDQQPGGNSVFDGLFNDVGNYGNWWSTSENSSNFAFLRFLSYDNEHAYGDGWFKSHLYSVRCLQD